MLEPELKKEHESLRSATDPLKKELDALKILLYIITSDLIYVATSAWTEKSYGN